MLIKKALPSVMVRTGLYKACLCYCCLYNPHTLLHVVDFYISRGLQPVKQEIIKVLLLKLSGVPPIERTPNMLCCWRPANNSPYPHSSYSCTCVVYGRNGRSKQQQPPCSLPRLADKHTHTAEGASLRISSALTTRGGLKKTRTRSSCCCFFELSRLSLLCTMLTVLLRQHGQFCAFLMPPLAHKGTAEGG